MSDLWTIKGQAGKAVNAVVRTLDELRAGGLNVTFRSLADDELTWNVWLKSTAEIATLVPEYGQRISLYLNGGRYFTGHVTGREPSFSAGAWGYSITVSGPWYWLAKQSLSSEIPDETTVVKKRAIYLFGTGSPTNHLISLVSRAMEVGLPLSLGSIATCANVPRISLREISYAEAISEVMRLVVDGLVHFDYSGADGTHPALSMQRRTPATTIQITPALVAVPTLKLRPRHDLQISELTVNYAKRETYGNGRATAFKSITAGASTGAMPDRQLITVSGPEPGLGLPQDLTDFVVVKSSLLAGNLGAALSIWHDLLKAGEADLSGVIVYQAANVDTASGITTSWPTDPLVIATDNEGNAIDLATWPYYLTKGEIKDWWKKDGIESIQARITATVASSQIGLTTDNAPEIPKWARVLGARASSHFIIEGGTLKLRYVWQATVSTVVPLVKTLWPVNTTLIRKEDWGWFNPPVGFANYLLQTQNFVPWEGEVPVATNETPPHNAVGSVLNIADWVPEAAAMRAMISGYSVRPATGQITYALGPPARHSFRDLVNRFRQTGADNTYWLGGSTPPEPDPNSNTILNEDGTVELDEAGNTAIDES